MLFRSGCELILTRARTAADVARTAEQWAAVGGTGVSVLTMKVGLDGYAAHVEYIAEVAAAVGLSAR